MKKRHRPSESQRVNFDLGLESVEVDHDPTAESEAEVFANEDDKALTRKHRHELDLLKAKKGWIGKITGSTNDTLNTGVFVLLISIALYAISEIAYIYRPSFAGVLDNLFKLILTVVGYVLGSYANRRK